MVKQKSPPGMKLLDLLRRRRLTLRTFIDQFGITTYEALQERCARMGVQAPTVNEWTVVAPEPVNSPTEGVVVLEPPPVIQEASGKTLDPDTWEPVPPTPTVTIEVVTEPGAIDELLPNPTGEHVWPVEPAKKTKKRKYDLPGED